MIYSPENSWIPDRAVGPLNDEQITELVREYGMIDPFLPNQIRTQVERELTTWSFRKGYQKEPAKVKTISTGLSSHGYDFRLNGTWKVLRQNYGFDPDMVLDPKQHNPMMWEEVQADVIELPPHGAALSVSLEHFRFPSHVVATVTGKSTYARVFLNQHMTPAEATWEGFLTVEFSNPTNWPLRIYAGPYEGVAQMLFWPVQPAQTSYANRPSTYQNQPPEVVVAGGNS